MSNKRPKVVIIGAGFGGLFTARHLARRDVDVLLIDRNNFHTFTPLIYQVATCGLEVDDVAYPVRKIFRDDKNIDFMLGEVLAIDGEAHAIEVRTNGNTRTVSYDYLVVAAGSATNYFGNEKMPQYAFGLKEMEDAVVLRNHMLRMFEKADWIKDPAKREAMTTLVVVGGGPTGLETAGALKELYDHVLRHEYRRLQDVPVRVVLVEAMPNLLGPYPSELQESAKKQIESIGVEVILNTSVEDVTDDSVRLSDGRIIPTYTLVWAAGVKASPLARMLNVELARGGRIPVQPTMEVIGMENVYAVGDNAYLEKEDGRPYPQLIPVAQQQAKLAARNILNVIAGKPQGTFTYFDKGTMATIGRSRAVVWAFNRFKMTGWFAWFAWLGLHLVTLMGFRNRMRVFINWMVNYMTYDQAARVIMEYKTEDAVYKAMRAEVEYKRER